MGYLTTGTGLEISAYYSPVRVHMHNINPASVPPPPAPVSFPKLRPSRVLAVGPTNQVFINATEGTAYAWGGANPAVVRFNSELFYPP